MEHNNAIRLDVPLYYSNLKPSTVYSEVIMIRIIFLLGCCILVAYCLRVRGGNEAIHSVQQERDNNFKSNSASWCPSFREWLHGKLHESYHFRFRHCHQAVLAENGPKGAVLPTRPAFFKRCHYRGISVFERSTTSCSEYTQHVERKNGALQYEFCKDLPQ
jgi:hypothetical protein